MPGVESSEKPVGSECRDRASLLFGPRRSRLEHAMNVVIRHRLAAGADLGVIELRAEAAAAQIDDDALDLHARHAFGRVDREPDRILGLRHVDDGAPP